MTAMALQSKPAEHEEWVGPSNNLWVGSLSPEVTDADLMDLVALRTIRRARQRHRLFFSQLRFCLLQARRRCQGRQDSIAKRSSSRTHHQNRVRKTGKAV